MNPDTIDLRILALLEQDGRATHAAIGRELGLTGPAVYARIRRLEEAGVIRGYRVDLDRVKMGRPIVAFVRLATRPIKVKTDTIEPYLWSDPRIVEAYDIAGEDTFILKVRCGSPEDLRNLLLDLRALPQVLRTSSSIALITVKEPGMPAPSNGSLEKKQL